MTSYNSEQIRKIVMYIQNSEVENKEEVFGKKYQVFKKNYPILFDMACRPEKIDEKMFNMMLYMLNQMENKNLSQFDASANVGQVLYDKYVKTAVENSPSKTNTNQDVNQVIE